MRLGGQQTICELIDNHDLEQSVTYTPYALICELYDSSKCHFGQEPGRLTIRTRRFRPIQVVIHGGSAETIL